MPDIPAIDGFSDLSDARLVFFQNSKLVHAPATGVGFVRGPASATDNAIVRFDGATGKIVQNSGIIIDDSNGVTGAGKMIVGHTAQLAVANTDNTQIIGATTPANGLALISFVNGGQAHLDFYSSPSGTIGTVAVIANGNPMGGINWYGAQETGNLANWTRAAQIRAEVDGVVTSGAGGDMPGRILFSTSPDGSATIVERLRIASTGYVQISNGCFGTTVPVTKTADFTVADSENYLINNKAAATCTVTLPSAAAFPGRILTIKTIQAFTVVSNASNVIPLAGGAAGTAILAATAGKWAILVSNGTNWEIMAAA